MTNWRWSWKTIEFQHATWRTNLKDCLLLEPGRFWQVGCDTQEILWDYQWGCQDLEQSTHEVLWILGKSSNRHCRKAVRRLSWFGVYRKTQLYPVQKSWKKFCKRPLQEIFVDQSRWVVAAWLKWENYLQKVWTVNLNLSRISPSSIPSWHLAYKFKLPMEFYFLCNVYRVSHDRFVVNAAWQRHSRFWSWYISGLWVAENVSSYTLSELKICWSSWTLKALWSVLMKDFSQFNSHKYKALYSQKSAWLILSLAKLSRPLTLKMSCCFKQETKDGVLFI